MSPLWNNKACFILLARPNPLTVEIREVRERSLTVQWTPAFDGGRPVTSYRVDLKSKQGTNSTETLQRFKVWLFMESCVIQPPGTLRRSLRSWTLSWASWLWWICVLPRPTTSACLPPTAWAPAPPATFWQSQPKKQVGLNHTELFFVEGTFLRTVCFAGSDVSSAPEGPPLDMQLESLTAHSIRVTWKVSHVLHTPQFVVFYGRSNPAPLKVWLIPSLAPKSRSHKRGPSQLHHQLQGVRPHGQAVQTVAPPEHQRHPGGGERRSEQPQALHPIWCAGPGKDKRRSGTCFHGAALLHPGWGWVSRIQLKDQVHFTSYKGVVFFSLWVLSSHNFRSCSQVDTRNRTFRPPGNNGNRSTCDCCHSVGRQQPDHQDDLGSGGTRLSSGF